MRIITKIAAIASLGTAGPALALPTGAHWIAVDNSTNPVTGELTGLDGLWRTYDLFVDLDPGDVVGGISFGIFAGNTGLSTDGVFFQTPAPFGSDSVIQNESLAADSLTAPFDTAVAMNNEPLLFAAAMDWDAAGVTGAWFSANLGQVGGPLFVGRFTVPIESTYLGGQIFVSGTTPEGNDFGGGKPENINLGIVDIPNAIPTPGASAVIALIGVASIRRRR